jgi:Fe-S-cluster containining protein
VSAGQSAPLGQAAQRQASHWQASREAAASKPTASAGQNEMNSCLPTKLAWRVHESLMEITIDFALVRKILREEYEQTRADIVDCGAVQAYGRSQRRHDAQLAAAPDASILACEAGCSWCCHFTVDVRPVEVFRILDFIEGNFTAQEQARVRSEIEANSAVLRPLDEVERMQRNIKCPFLSACRCTIYPARPQTCRNYHATDAAGCRKSFEEPDNIDIDPDFAPLVYQTGGAHVDGFSKAMLEAGYDVSAYELNSALAAAMVEPVAARQRFEAGAQAFPSLQGADVPLEFAEE